MRSLTKNILLAFISLATAAFICQFKGDDWEERLRQTLYRLTNDSIPDYAKTLVDEKGIPYVHYANYKTINPGNQYNPTIVSNYAINYYELMAKKKDPVTEEKFIHCIDWLLGNISVKAVLTYAGLVRQVICSKDECWVTIKSYSWATASTLTFSGIPCKAVFEPRVMAAGKAKERQDFPAPLVVT